MPKPQNDFADICRVHINYIILLKKNLCTLPYLLQACYEILPTSFKANKRLKLVGSVPFRHTYLTIHPINRNPWHTTNAIGFIVIVASLVQLG